jgi:hypothetical protein
VTQEQWIIYLYGIYPEGEFSLIWLFLLSIWLVYIGILYISFSTEARYEEKYIVGLDKAMESLKEGE